MKWYWYVIMVLVWILAVVLAAAASWWYLLLALAAIDLVEYLAAGLWIGRKAGTNAALNLIMSLLFGFVWWISLKRRSEQVPSETTGA